jgi:acyl phosphate:glycerol-3-phosphate acyltransferase
MTAAQQLLTLVPISYVLGSLPFGLWVGLSKGIDPRTAGSGNIGATNLGRLLGGKFFAIVFALDFLKGMIPTLAASWVVHHASGTRDAAVYLLWLLVGFAAIAGHMFSLVLRFKGGKGVATSTGVMVGVFPDYTLAAAGVVLVFVACFYLTRIISLASILGAVTFPLIFLGISLWRGQPVLGERWPLLAFAVIVGGMVIWKHRGNIKRLRAGTEPRFGKPAKAGA